METPFAGLPCEVGESLDRAANRDQHCWRMGVRRGPIADWTAPSRSNLGLRRTSLRGILCVLAHPGQGGCPAAMNTGACLGFAATANQSAFLASKSRDAQRGLLVRVAGRLTQGRQATEKDIAQRA